jgi:hypothetical protein
MQQQLEFGTDSSLGVTRPLSLNSIMAELITHGRPLALADSEQDSER